MKNVQTTRQSRGASSSASPAAGWFQTGCVVVLIGLKSRGRVRPRRRRRFFDVCRAAL